MIFERLQAVALAENTRLGQLILKCLAKYRTLQLRYSYIDRIPEREGECVQRLPTAWAGDPNLKGNEVVVRLLLAEAMRHEKEFRAQMSELVYAFNEADSVADLCRRCGIDEMEDIQLELRGESLELKVGSRDIVFAMFGPPKEFGRALAKEARSLKDLNRVTFEFEDPYVLALMFAALRKKFKVVAFKNKFKQETLKQRADLNVTIDLKEIEPPDLHLNIEFKDVFVVEAQLLLKDFLTIKKTQHKFYEIVRAVAPVHAIMRAFTEAVGEDEVCGCRPEAINGRRPVTEAPLPMQPRPPVPGCPSATLPGSPLCPVYGVC